MLARFGASVLLMGLVAACSGNGGAGDQPAAGGAASPAGGAAAPSETMAAPSGPIDEALAHRGEQLFQSKGCIGCHTIGGGRLTGPDLKGVTQRRDYGWIVAMVTNPDSMLQADPTARQLFGQYMTPMLNMGVTRDDARAIYEYLREEGESEESSSDHPSS